MTTFNIFQILTPIFIFLMTILLGVIGWLLVKIFGSHEATQKELKESQIILGKKIDEIGVNMVTLKAELVARGECLFKMSNMEQKIHEVHQRIDEHVNEAVV